MISFESQQFLDELKEKMQYWEDTSNSHDICELLGDFYPLLDESFDPSEFDDEFIGYDSVIPLNCENSISISCRDLFEIMNISKKTKLIDNLICFSDCYSLCRVSVDYEKAKILEPYFSCDKAFINNDHYKSSSITCSITRGFTLFGYMIMKSGDFDDDYLPALLDDELFIEIVSDEKLQLNDYENITNSYIFEIDSSYNISLRKARRPQINYDDECNEDDDETKKITDYKLRPLLFGKGLTEVVKLYNSATISSNPDMVIIQYTKVLEFISQTVIRQKTTQTFQNKLMDSRALNPNADFIKELEVTFDDLHQKYGTDRDAIIALIETCCDIRLISRFAPKYLSKLRELENTLSKIKCNREDCIKESNELLANSISDTRNYIAHSKANYTLKETNVLKAKKMIL